MLAAAVLAAGCGGTESQEGSAPATDAGASVVDLASAQPFVERFDADRGKARLLLILSPT